MPAVLTVAFWANSRQDYLWVSSLDAQAARGGDLKLFLALALHTRCNVTPNGPERKRARLSRGRARGKTDYPAGRWDEIKGGRGGNNNSWGCLSFLPACVCIVSCLLLC